MINGEKFYFESDAKDPYLFTIELEENRPNKEVLVVDADGKAVLDANGNEQYNTVVVPDEVDHDLAREGFQYDYTLNYTAGQLTRATDGTYEFKPPTGLDPTTVGFGENEFDTYLKFVSNADLLSYGAVKTGTTDEAGNEIFEWDLEGDGDESSQWRTQEEGQNLSTGKPSRH